jgi:hypothetical protein
MANELVKKYQAEITQAVINAVKLTRSCVLFYRDIYHELADIIKDEETFRSVESALWETLDGLRLGDIVLHKIYVDPDESFHEVVVVTFGKKLTEEQLRILREVASLLSTDFYDRYSEADGQFYDAMPLYFYDRTEIYTTLHNLVRKWAGCDTESLLKS